jgi:hypothetical protein
VPYYLPLTASLSQEENATLQAQCIALEAASDGVATPLTPNEKHIIVVDTGASITITNNKMDFVSAIYWAQPAKLQGIA